MNGVSRSCHVLILSVYAYSKIKPSAEISHLEVPEKGPRKRPSTTAMRKNDKSRKKVANAPSELESSGGPEKIEVDEEALTEWDMNVTKAEIGAKLEAEEQAGEDGKRVEKVK